VCIFSACNDVSFGNSFVAFHAVQYNSKHLLCATLHFDKETNDALLVTE